jgi:hypothetical protein
MRHENKTKRQRTKRTVLTRARAIEFSDQISFGEETLSVLYTDLHRQPWLAPHGHLRRPVQRHAISSASSTYDDTDDDYDDGIHDRHPQCFQFPHVS